MDYQRRNHEAKKWSITDNNMIHCSWLVHRLSGIMFIKQLETALKAYFSFLGMTGRLGNIISNYVNFIALQWTKGYKYVPSYPDYYQGSLIKNIAKGTTDPTRSSASTSELASSKARVRAVSDKCRQWSDLGLIKNISFRQNRCMLLILLQFELFLWKSNIKQLDKSN